MTDILSKHVHTGQSITDAIVAVDNSLISVPREKFVETVCRVLEISKFDIDERQELWLEYATEVEPDLDTIKEVNSKLDTYEYPYRLQSLRKEYRVVTKDNIWVTRLLYKAVFRHYGVADLAGINE